MQYAASKQRNSERTEQSEQVAPRRMVIWASRGSLSILLASVVLLGGCGKDTGHSEALTESGKKSEVLRVFVSILPQAYFVERVGGERVRVEVLVGTGQSPHTYAPTPQQVAGLERCDAYFSIGLPFEERLLAKAASSLPLLNVVDCRAGVELRLMEAAHDHDHAKEDGGAAATATPAANGSHDAAHAHEHNSHDHGACVSAGEMDPHVWLDPKRVMVIAENICGELCRLDPDHGAEYRENLRVFKRELGELDERIAAALKPLAGREFFVFHPAYGYFGDSYGLKQVAVEIEGKDPTPRQIASLIAKARASGVRVIFAQPQFSDKSAEAIAREIDGAVVPLDPLAKDYIGNLDEMARRLVEALGTERP